MMDQAVRNDTYFLHNSQVMDYSMLLGIDTVKHVCLCLPSLETIVLNSCSPC